MSVEWYNHNDKTSKESAYSNTASSMVWITYDRDLEPASGIGRFRGSYGLEYSESEPLVTELYHVWIIKERGSLRKCAAGSSGCRTVELRMGKVIRGGGNFYEGPFGDGPAPDETVLVSYRPHLIIWRHDRLHGLRGAFGTTFAAGFSRVEAEHLVAGTDPALSVEDARGTETDDETIAFKVKMTPAATRRVTVRYATADGTATAGEDGDYTDTSGRLTFDAGEKEKTINVPLLDDTVEDSGETFTLTLSGALRARLVDATATGTIYNDEAEIPPGEGTPLLAFFGAMPASHDGSAAFAFQLEFSEEFPVSAETLRDSAFDVTGGQVSAVRQVDPNSNRRWEITVEPASEEAVTVTLPATTDCTTTGAICTADNRALSAAVSATVPEAIQPKANSPATGQPTVSGTAQVGETLTAETSGIEDADGLNNVAYGYQWLAADAEIAGATSNSYTLAEADEGKVIKVRVSFTDDGENQETLTSAPTETVDVSESHDRPHNLRATVAEGAITLTWQDPDTHPGHGLYHILRHRPELGEDKSLVYVEYAPSTDRTFTDSAVEPGVLYVYAVKAVKDPFGFLGPASDPVEVRMPPGEGGEAPNSPATGQPTISGTVQVGERLTADTSGIADTDGLDNASFAHQWMADDSDIAGATGSTYTLDPGDEAKRVKVRVTFTDDAGNAESLTSAATNEVEARPNSPATGQPTVTGTAQVGETLTADTSGIADADGLDNASFAYQWMADDSAIAGATDSTYTLDAGDEGKAIKVEVSFTDDAGNEESLTSAATSAVAAVPVPLTVSLENAATPHDGTAVFTFELRFSEHIADLSYITMRDDAFTVTGGQVTKARRMDPHSDTRNIHWEITVTPSGNGDVTIVLPATNDCDAEGAICAEDGGKLSNSLNFTASGPGQ